MPTRQTHNKLTLRNNIGRRVGERGVGGVQKRTDHTEVWVWPKCGTICDKSKGKTREKEREKKDKMVRVSLTRSGPVNCIEGRREAGKMASWIETRTHTHTHTHTHVRAYTQMNTQFDGHIELLAIAAIWMAYQHFSLSFGFLYLALYPVQLG